MGQNLSKPELSLQRDFETTSRTDASISATSGVDTRLTLDTYVALVQAVQVIGLSTNGTIDENASAAMLRAIDTTQRLTSPQGASAWQIVSLLDDRVDQAIPGEIAGAGALGRTRSETIATALRMMWREESAELVKRSLRLQAGLIELASAHTVTVMGAFADRRAAAPTTLGHFLGGVIDPLATSSHRLLAAIDQLDRSPLGSGLLVGEVFGADRDQTASLLGFREAIPNTFDASGSVEDIVPTLDTIAAHAAVIRRFVNELLIWIRTDATSFFIDERWESVPEPAHAAHAVSSRLEHLNVMATNIELQANAAVTLLRAQPFGPISVNWDPVARSVVDVLESCGVLLKDTDAAIREALIVNRAYLANRAGRLYSTATDIAAFLMEDQQLSPAAAQRIAGLAVARLKEASLEAAQITPDIIDAAAVMVIGQELKVEMETLGRYIAPRRYIERRDVLGSPKSDRTRAWLEKASNNLRAVDEQISERMQRWNNAARDVRATLAESAETSEN